MLLGISAPPELTTPAPKPPPPEHGYMNGFQQDDGGLRGRNRKDKMNSTTYFIGVIDILQVRHRLKLSLLNVQISNCSWLRLSQFQTAIPDLTFLDFFSATRSCFYTLIVVSSALTSCSSVVLVCKYISYLTIILCYPNASFLDGNCDIFLWFLTFCE